MWENVQKSANFKMYKLLNKQGWAIACFENVQLLFYKEQNLHFFGIFISSALFERAIL